MEISSIKNEKERRGNMSNIALEVQSLTKQIGKKKIVDNVSFQIMKGEIFGLLGPNGAGKTTIIKMIVSLINRTNGKVIVNGHDLDESFSKTLNEIGAIVENPEFYKYLSGYKNLKHYARMAIKDISDEKIMEITKLVGLEDAIHNKVKTYSLGMRQRLGVAQALLHDPSVLILDEPTNGLDPQGIREFREHLKVLAKKGISVLVSSHLLSEMQLMCDRYAIIEKGKLIHIASIEESDENESNAVKEVTFVVNDSQKAVELIEHAALNGNFVVKNGQEFHAMIEYNSIPKINKVLVQGDIDVFSIQVSKKTLEDRFLEITNAEKSGEEK